MEQTKALWLNFMYKLYFSKEPPCVENVRDAGKIFLPFFYRRSDYENAPGGCVCLKEEMLSYVHDYAVQYNDETGYTHI